MTEDEQTEKGLPFTRIEDISAQNRPLIASPDDTVVGFDELGGTVYKARTGEEYTLYPETKTPQERPIVSAAKAVGEYLSDPSMPSLEETSEFAKEAVKGAYEPFRKIATGDSPTYGDLSEVLPVSLSGAATRIGKPFDSTVVSSGGAGPTYKPKMFSSGEVGLSPSNYSVAEFYSPTVETLRNTEFPSKGYKGSELLKLLKDKTPGVRKAELDAMDLGIDPQQRYTKEDVLGLAEKRSYKVTAQEVDDPQFKYIQRQSIKDQEVGYATIKINATPNSEDVQPFLPIRGYTHYDPETIAHTRVSIREGQDGAEYLLVEEIQSDLIQHGSVKPRGPITVDDAYEEVLDLLADDISKDYPDLKADYENNQRYFDNLFKVGAENSRQYRLREQGFSVPQEELDAYEKLVEETRDLATQVGDASYSPGFSKLATMMENAGYEEGYRIDRRTGATGLSPLTEDSDAVRLALQTAMAKASDSDVTSLVIPNIQRIITADRARFGSAEYEKYMKPSSGFQRTYVKGVEKFIKQLQSEYGDRVKVSTVELPYTKEKLYFGGEGVDVPKTAIKIDFSDLRDVNFRVGRFAEGGMVEDDQMNRLMQEGGMADDGMDREPVTGNEIPPGSLASEVRDDIDAKLSEGEYVIPADVLRFFGVRFFEDLRRQAKEGMMQMESEGRIGGAPVDAQGIPAGEGDEELTPEEEQMLQEALGGAGMAYGGMVEQTMANPYQDQATLYQMPAGMAEGGMAFDRTQFTLNEPPAVPGSPAGIEVRKYINPTTKEERTVNFMNGMPLGIIPEGFVPWSQELAGQPTTPTTTPTTPTVAPVETQRGGGEGRGQQAPATGEGTEGAGYQGWGDKNREAISSDPYSFGVDALSDKGLENIGRGAAIAGMVVGGPIGAVAGAFGLGAKATSEIQNIAEARAALSVMEAKGLKGTTQYSDLEARVEDKISSLPVAQRAAVRMGIVATGNQYAAAALSSPSTPSKAATGTPSKAATGTTGTGGKSAGEGPAKTTSGKSLGFSPSTTGGKAVSTGTISTGGQRESLGYSASTTGGKSVSAQSSNAKDYSLGTPAGKSTSAPSKSTSGTGGGGADSGKAANSGGYGQGGSNATRRAEGGLITKPAKTTSKKKGLAS